MGYRLLAQVFFDLLLDTPLQLPGSCHGTAEPSHQISPPAGSAGSNSGGGQGLVADIGAPEAPHTLRALEVIVKLVSGGAEGGLARSASR